MANIKADSIGDRAPPGEACGPPPNRLPAWPHSPRPLQSLYVRLGEFDGVTIGVKYGRILASGNEWTARLESYSTTGNGPDSVVYPELDAVIFQMSYNFAIGGRR